MRHTLPSLLLLACCATSTKPEAPGAGPVAASPVAAAPEPPSGMRLPASLKPLAQRVHLTIVPSASTFEGTTELDVDLATSTDVLWLNAKGLSVHTATVTFGTHQAVAQVFTSPERLALRVPASVGPGRATLRLSFTGPLSDTEVTGLFHQKDGGQWYAMSKFEATDARRAFPCVDEPSAKIPWELTLTVPKALTAVSNTPVAAEEADGESKHVRFAQTKPLPSYLVAFGVGPYDVVEARPAGINQVPMRIYALQGRAAEAAYAARVSPQLLETIEAYFGIPFPYPKLDVLAIPVSSGAMENAGLVSVTSSALLARKENDTLQFQRSWASVGAHEFAHQWFGDSVTMAWWDDLWLNEAFATWMAAKTLETWAPAWGTAVADVQDRSGAAAADTLSTARSIRQPIESYDDIVNAFDSITYQKGAAVLRMFEAYLGPEKFQAGVQRYLRAHANANATSADFLAAISEATGQEVAPAFNTFLDQSGVPELAVSLACAKGTTAEVQMAQQPLLPVGSRRTADRLWQLPVCARWPSANGEGRACTLSNVPAFSLPLSGRACPPWVLPNAGYTGYYRLALPVALLRTLTTAGRSSLTQAETVGLLGDVRALVSAGRTPQALGLELATRFAGAPQRRVLAEAMGLATVHRDFLEGGAATAYPGWVVEHFAARARALGFRSKPGEDEDTRLLRPALVQFVAIRGEDTQLIAAARAETQAWLKDRSAVEPEMVGTDLAIAGAFGDASLHAALVKRLAETQDRATRGQLIGALSSFQDPALVRTNLRLVETTPLDYRELLRMLLGPLQWPNARQLVFEKVSQDFDQLASRLPERSVAQLFHAGDGFCDAQHRAAVEAAFAPRAAKVLGGKRELAQTLERIDLCIAVRAVQVPTINGYFQHSKR